LKEKIFELQMFLNFWIRIGIQPKMLDPDPYQMNTDPKQWTRQKNYRTVCKNNCDVI